MEYIYKEVNFTKYCPLCEESDTCEEKDPCNVCLFFPMNEHSEKPVFQKDLEENFQIARSTATGILQLMEKKDLIVRKPYPGDARLKRLELTARAEKYQHGIMHNFDLLQIALKKDIPQEKLDTFFQVVDMIKNNIEKEDFHDKNIIEPGKGV